MRRGTGCRWCSERLRNGSEGWFQNVTGGSRGRPQGRGARLSSVEERWVNLADFALVDGNRDPEMFCTVRTVVKGDGLSLSIAAASIVAKVTRDHMMSDLDQQFPGYGWAHNAGYGTAEHKAALARLGVTPVHRKSFAPIRKMLSPEAS